MQISLRKNVLAMFEYVNINKLIIFTSANTVLVSTKWVAAGLVVAATKQAATRANTIIYFIL